ncbi:MAG: hypothetical protein A2729_02465 [Candidatus Buchananbacteria bacterium RIFCSPHIGHO2_01_FULL_39_14]|uniref:Uncharacterized protein n=2 Tax=Candidatus Buchananiibacteriota TaxID=1817903 RepID=A0A1G1YNH6_9BACT|nr:MAG: hypothetical protein A2729_02465 [Candidatus Buchananbacteria bacterium RIFCSPHIGHO2_01_FULL_39_14]OGY48595.1 MAG: hypothetical protein A3D39_01975 [Candidatus Buchananbacteria bacterium RIFCSPHIGHO2_02_FULL_39_17]OGY53913.1 MAG: hypothetical protein A2912_05010 [Candidatus Buchananbacteria bacterium RIFCSPLOWO2_01_FULL_40_23b]
MNMNWKPTKGRVIFTIILFLVLFFIVEFLWGSIFRTFDAPQNYGFPFTYLINGGWMTPSGPGGINEFYWTGLAGDVITWLIISYVLSVFIIRKKKRLENSSS